MTDTTETKTRKRSQVAIRDDAPPPAPMSETASIMAMIERMANDPTIQVERVQQLLAMYEQTKARLAKTAFDAAMSVMQTELPAIQKNGRIVIKEKGTEKVIQSTPYALWEDINDAIKPKLAQHGFALSFRTGLAGDGKITVTGILSHAEGHREETTITLPHDSTGSKNAVQAVGSSTSYGKRYVATSLLNLTSRTAEDRDDDGQAAGAAASITPEQVEQLQTLIVQSGADIPKFLKYFKVETLADLSASRFKDAVDALNAKGRKG